MPGTMRVLSLLTCLQFFPAYSLAESWRSESYPAVPVLTCGWRCPVGWTSWISLALALIRLRAPWRRRGLLPWRYPSPILWRWGWRPRASSEMSPCAMLRWPLGWGMLGAPTWFFTRDWGDERWSPLSAPREHLSRCGDALGRAEAQ